MTIKLADLCADFEEALEMACPYVSPGNTAWSTISQGVDCSGLFVAAFKKQGGSIYHGSNTMARKYTTELTTLTKAAQLFPGAVVYKWANDGGEPSKYQGDGLGDFVHVGLCVATNPLKIIHASSAAGKVTSDSVIGKWKYFGKLTGVDYSVIEQDEQTEEDDDQMDDEIVGGTLKTLKAMNIRQDDTTASTKLGSVPKGTVLEFEGDPDEDMWVMITYNDITGYICTDSEKNYVEILSTYTDADIDAPTYDDSDSQQDNADTDLAVRVSDLEEGERSQVDINEDIVSILRTLCKREGITWPGIRHMNTNNITSYEADE